LGLWKVPQPAQEEAALLETSFTFNRAAAAVPMSASLQFSNHMQALFVQGKQFDPWALKWMHAERLPDDLRPIELLTALGWLFREGGARGVPVAVIGPNNANAEQLALAERLGRRLGEIRIPILCGGKSGVMEAVCKGCHEAGGLSIGMLPDDEWTTANAYVSLPLATGLGPARNAIIARAAFALIAIGGGYGTLSEMAFGMHFDRLVLALADAPELPGVARCASLDEALERVAARLLRLDVDQPDLVEKAGS
jgi:uncharacterized protein (TIGR00725 family)